MMKLVFSVSAAALSARREEIAALTRQTLGVEGEFDLSAGRLRVALPDGTDPSASAARLCAALGAAGITAVYLPGEREGHFTRAARARHTVSLRLFLIVLIVSVLTVAIVTATATFSVATFLFQRSATLGTKAASGESYADKIALVDEIFRQYSLYDTNGDLLLDEMLKAYAAATGDDYAEYYTDAEYAVLTADQTSRAVGIGIRVIEDDATHAIRVISVSLDSPAAAAGVLTGDLITRVGTGDESTAVTDMGYEPAVAALRGEEGTTAAFTVLRDGVELPFSVTRAAITVTEVTGCVSETDARVGVIHIEQFSAATPRQFSAEMDRLLAAGCDRFVLDLRNDPGGELRSVSAMLSFFLNEGDTILSVVSKDGSTEYEKVRAVTYTDDYADCSVAQSDIGKYRAYPAALLINGNTASAAELFTAALVDNGLAVTVGEKTYGKGIIQSIYSLSYWGYSGAIKLTVGYFCPPGGVNFHGKGIEPAVPVSLSEAAKAKNFYTLTEAEDDQLQTAISQILQ